MYNVTKKSNIELLRVIEDKCWMCGSYLYYGLQNKKDFVILCQKCKSYSEATSKIVMDLFKEEFAFMFEGVVIE